MLRIYRATGRGTEADALAQQYLTKLRPDENPFSRLDLAALAANEGLKDEAVATLTALFERYPLVEWFFPQLPWFRSLEGHPGYDKLMAQRKRRVSRPMPRCCNSRRAPRGLRPAAAVGGPPSELIIRENRL